MEQVDPNIRSKTPRVTLAIAAVTSAFAVGVALPASAYADPVPSPAPPAPPASPTSP
uniref:APA family fibronectin-binding glycoprotein n=1 Tax=Mycobacterium sp. Marseille-P9652 TaxID=2654950 RepID=UPI00351A2FDF